MPKLFHKCIVSVAKRATGRDLVVDDAVDGAYLAGRILELVLAAFRGLWKGMPGSFVSTGVRVRCRSKLHLGTGVIIKHGALIDGHSKEGIRFGRQVSIGRHSIIDASGSLSKLGVGIVFGDNVGLGDFAHIGGGGGVRIGSDTIIGAFFSVHPENHQYEAADIPIRMQGVTRAGIEIGSNCWIGAKVTVLDGARIGSGTVVAAGAVVVGAFPDDVILAGVPARVLRKRVNPLD